MQLDDDEPRICKQEAVVNSLLGKKTEVLLLTKLGVSAKDRNRKVAFGSRRRQWEILVKLHKSV